MHRHIYWQAMPTRLPAGGLYYLCCFSCIGTSDCCSYGQYGDKLAQMIMQGRQLWYGSLQDRAESRAAACWQEDAGMAGQAGVGGWGGRGGKGVCLDDTVQMEPQRVQWLQGTSHQNANWNENAKADHHENAMHLWSSTSLRIYDTQVLHASICQCTPRDITVPAHLPPAK